MSVYEYKCVDCGHITEIQQPITEDILPIIPCEQCDSMAKKIMSRCTFKLVGEGWPGKDLRRGIDE